MQPLNNPISDALIRLGSAAQALGLPHLIIGGNAVIHHGVARFTRDIDFLIPKDDQAAWHEMLALEGYQLYHAAGAFAQYEAQSSGMGIPPVDLMMVDAATWEKLNTGAEQQSLAETYSAAWPSPLHLIALKLHAWRGEFRSDRERDWSDVLGLIHQCQIDIHDPTVRSVIIKYGGDEAFARLEPQ